MVIPMDGSDPIHIHEAGDPRPPLVGVGLVTPFVAQKWLHAGEPVYRPVVIHDEDYQLIAGKSVLEMAKGAPDMRTSAAVVKLGHEQADTAWTAAQAMRIAFQLPEADDVDGLVLAHDGGQVLGGASALYDLRKPTVFIVLIVNPNDGQWN
jgi:hypothetical protein